MSFQTSAGRIHFWSSRNGQVHLHPDWVLPTLFIPTQPSCPEKSIILLPHSAISEQLTTFKDLRKVWFPPSAVHSTFNAFCMILKHIYCSYLQQSHPACGFQHYFVLIWRDVLSHLKHQSFYHTLRTRSNSTISGFGVNYHIRKTQTACAFIILTNIAYHSNPDVLSHQKHSSIYQTLWTRSNSTDSWIWKTRLQGATYIPTRFSNHIITNNTITLESAPSCPSKTSIFIPHLWSQSNSPTSRICTTQITPSWQ